MGCYVNPKGMTKEDWLAHHGVLLRAEEYRTANVQSLLQGGMILLVHVDNGPFTALGVVYNEAERVEFDQPDDHRPKSFWLADVDEVRKVAPLDQYLES